MIIKSTVLAVIVFLGSLGIAAAQSSEPHGTLKGSRVRVTQQRRSLLAGTSFTPLRVQVVLALAFSPGLVRRTVVLGTRTIWLQSPC
jgi:hypothetical protein